MRYAAHRAAERPSTSSPPQLYPQPSSRENSHPQGPVLGGERKRVTLPFTNLKDSMELLADRDRGARQLVDPVVERMIATVHGSFLIEARQWISRV
jgi:hypothetical protein